jgi:hypothetical protein
VLIRITSQKILTEDKGFIGAGGTNLVSQLCGLKLEVGKRMSVSIPSEGLGKN